MLRSFKGTPKLGNALQIFVGRRLHLLERKHNFYQISKDFLTQKS